MAQREERVFESDGRWLNYVDGEAGGPPILLLHAFFYNWIQYSEDFSSMIENLEPKLHPHCFDFRGHEKSFRAPSYRVDDYAGDTSAFIEGCISQPAILFGHSMGDFSGS